MGVAAKGISAAQTPAAVRGVSGVRGSPTRFLSRLSIELSSIRIQVPLSAQSRRTVVAGPILNGWVQPTNRHKFKFTPEYGPSHGGLGFRCFITRDCVIAVVAKDGAISDVARDAVVRGQED